MVNTLELESKVYFKVDKKKVIFIDFGLFLHRAVFGMELNPLKIPATYSCLRKIFNTLLTLGYTDDDLVIVCIDGKGSWRRELDPSYKANRKEKRDASNIDWYHWFGEFNKLVEKLKLSTPFNYIRLDKIEADDIISVGCRYFKDRECIIVSSDSDFHQLTAFDNVKIFSPVNMRYKVIDVDPYNLIQKKIRKETTDNLKNEVTNEFEYEVRNTLVNLLKLPDDIEEKVLDKLKEVRYNDFDINEFPFDSLLNLFMSLGVKEVKVETYNKALKRELRKKKGKKNARNSHKVYRNKEIL